MKRYALKRAMSLLPTMFIISLFLFGLMKLMPQDPVALSMPSYVKPAQYERVYAQVEKKLGLDASIGVQYVKWLSNMARGDFGTSIIYKKPVLDVIAKPLRNTFLLNSIVFLVSTCVALGSGIYSSYHPHSLWDRIFQGFSLLGMSVPSFFIALLLIYGGAFLLQIVPSGGMPLSGASLWDWLRALCLPVCSLAILNIAGTYRYVRSSMLEILAQDYIKAARARGLTSARIAYHALRNCLLPLLTIFMSQVSTLLFGSVLIENIFAFDGIGKVLLLALQRRDFMLAIALNIVYALLYLLCNFISDLLYAWVDPRVRLS